MAGQEDTTIIGGLVCLTCLHCGERCERSRHNGRARKFCSLPCFYANQKATRENRRRERFWAKVNKNGPVPEHVPHLGPCWVWTGALNHGGYGRLIVGTKAAYQVQLAHRTSWLMHFGLMPEDKPYVLHHCDNSACVRPNHLWVGTLADNNADRHTKGRDGRAVGEAHGSRTKPESICRGERQGSSKLTEAQVVEIRRLFDAGYPIRLCQEEYGVTRSALFRIARRKGWSHVPEAGPTAFQTVTAAAMAIGALKRIAAEPTLGVSAMRALAAEALRAVEEAR